MFADDGLFLTDSPEKVKIILAALQRWASRWGMKYGVETATGSKSAVMAVLPEDMQVPQEMPLQWTLDGKRVPLVKKYKYLGMEINDALDLGPIVAQRVRVANLRYHGLTPLFADPWTALPLKLQVLRTVLLPVIRYGGELLGMNAKRAQAMQKVLSNALRLCFNTDRHTSPSIECLTAEAQIPAVHSMWTAQRVRALTKYKVARTVDQKIFNRPLDDAPQHCWTRQTIRQAQQYGLPAQGLSGPPLSREMHLQLARRTSKEACHVMQEKRKADDKCRSWKEYTKRRLSRTVKDGRHMHWAWINTRYGNLALALRAACYPGARRLARKTSIPQEYLNQCPHCLARTPDTLDHFIAACPAFAPARQSCLIDPLRRHLGVTGVPLSFVEELIQDPQGLTAVCLGGEWTSKENPALTAALPTITEWRATHPGIPDHAAEPPTFYDYQVPPSYMEPSPEDHLRSTIHRRRQRPSGPGPHGRRIPS
jgi:hypothetical protein